jgi:NCAIR mutase (PurE)-related protein
MPAAKHNVLPVDWSEIRRACEAGLGLSEAARKWGIDSAAVRMRAMREKWIHPAKVAKLAEKFKEQKQAALPTVTNPLQQGAPLTAATAVTESIAEMGVQLQTTVLSKTLQALKKANLSDLPINSWQDAKLATEVGLKVAGLESQAGPAVSLVFTGTGDLPPLVEIDATAKPITGENEQFGTDLL